MVIGGKNAFIFLWTYLLINTLQCHANDTILNNEILDETTNGTGNAVAPVIDSVNSTVPETENSAFSSVTESINSVQGRNESDISTALLGEGFVTDTTSQVASQNGAVNVPLDKIAYFAGGRHKPSGYSGKTLFIGENNSLNKITGNEGSVDVIADSVLRNGFGRYQKSSSEGKQD